MKKFLMYGAIAFLGMGAVACGCDDPLAEPIAPPTVERVPDSVTGVITDMQGNPVAGATVKIGSTTVTTNEEGIYVVPNLAPGNYNVTVSAANKVTQESTITIADSSSSLSYAFNAALASAENVKDVNVTVDGGGEGEVESETIRNNEEGKVEIAIEVPAQTVPANTNITLSPLYQAEDAGSRAEADEMLIGATLACSDPNLRLSQPIDLSFAVDNSVSTSVVTKMYQNGRWVEIDHTDGTDGGSVVIKAREFTSYALFYRINIVEEIGYDAITFSPRSVWDNYNGSSPMSVRDVTYNYFIGTDVAVTATNNLEGLMIELLARRYGTRVNTAAGTYPIDVRLPMGTSLIISGRQAYTSIRATAAGRTVSAKSYGTVEVTVRTTSVDHEGGSNVPGTI